MNILLVDDENTILLKTKNVILRSDLNFNNIYTATNYDEAVNIIDKFSPDIIVTDIKMPGKSGMDLLNYTFEKFEYKPVIMLSGYFEYEYTKQAFGNKAFDYLLKPVDDGELVDSIENACEQLVKYNKQKQNAIMFKEYFEANMKTVRGKFFESLLMNNLSNQLSNADFTNFNIDLKDFRLIAIEANTKISINAFESGYYCANCIEQYLDKKIDNLISCSFGNIIFFIFPIENTFNHNDYKSTENFMAAINEEILDNLFINSRIGISKKSSDIFSINKLMKECFYCLDALKSSDEIFMLFYDEIDEETNIKYDINDDLQKLLTYILNDSRSLAIECIEFIYNNILSKANENLNDFFILIVANIRLILLNLNSENNKLNLDINEFESQMNPNVKFEKIKSVVIDACIMVSEHKNNKQTSLIQNINRFIYNNFQQNIGLQDLAEYTKHNASYISRIIKEHTGKNFTQILTEKRIEEAKKLLKNTNNKINDIAIQIGYPNPKYFNRIFKSYVNMSAGDYRELISTFSNK